MYAVNYDYLEMLDFNYFKLVWRIGKGYYSNEIGNAPTEFYAMGWVLS
jgi:hypothetical protein